MEFTVQERKKYIDITRNQWMTSLELKTQFLKGNGIETLVSMADSIASAIAQGGKLMLCGNGGSAADAQHLACELLVRLRSSKNRAPIPALSLALDTSTITACTNDYNFEQLYSRMVQALGRPGDVLLGLTTSGRSKNVINALKTARELGIVTFGFLGGNGGLALAECDLSLVIPGTDPNRIQEIHITAGHILMDLIESMLLERKEIALMDEAVVTSPSVTETCP